PILRATVAVAPIERPMAAAYTIVSIDSLSPTVATEFGPRRETKKTSTTANTDSRTSSSTIGIASSRIARPIGPSVYSPWCEPAIDSRTVLHRLASLAGAATFISLMGQGSPYRGHQGNRGH